MVKIRVKNCKINDKNQDKFRNSWNSKPKDRKARKRSKEKTPAHALIESTYHKITGDIETGKSIIKKLDESSWINPIKEKPSCSFQRCPICLDTYDSVEKQPICLPCGHTFCKVCVSRIKVTIGMSQCPYDRKEFNSFMEFLPVNYALIQEKDNTRKRCPEHGLYIIGFCIEHSRLLCGKCLFEHKTHTCIDLESEEVSQLVREKTESIDKLQAKLEYQISKWTEAHEKIIEYVTVINQNLMDHPLEKVEKELIRIIHKNVEDFKRKIAEFQMFVSVELKESMTGVVEGLKGHLRIITDLKNNFDRMDTKDILTLNLDCKSDLNFIPKSVKELKKLCEMIEKPLKLEELLANGLPVKC